MWAFRRQIRINTVDEALMFCDLIVEEVPHMDPWEVAEQFGCEFTCDDHGELINPDYSPMIGEWNVNFSWTFGFGGDLKTMLVTPIIPHTQDVKDIVAEYKNARDYCAKDGTILDKVKEFKFKDGETIPEDLLNEWLAIDMKKYKEMDRRRDIATGDLNPYLDYTGMEEYTKWLFK